MGYGPFDFGHLRKLEFLRNFCKSFKNWNKISEQKVNSFQNCQSISILKHIDNLVMGSKCSHDTLLSADLFMTISVKNIALCWNMPYIWHRFKLSVQLPCFMRQIFWTLHLADVLKKCWKSISIYITNIEV